MNLNYNWKLSETTFTKDSGGVFSCFACGGGSTMGYKLAGFDVIGCNEIDKKINDVYIANHNPKYNYCCDIRSMLDMELPQEMYELDILDGSPPCSSFSMSGNREKDWGKDKKFKEGQTKQVLDTLFFDFIALANKLRPKVVIAENVKGILMGNAMQYVRRIYEEFDNAGYYCRHFLLDASKMGVPQRRERVFFIAVRKDLAQPILESSGLFDMNFKLELNFNEKEILFSHIKSKNGMDIARKLTSHKYMAWLSRKQTDTKISHSKVHCGLKETDFNCHYAKDNEVLHTLVAKGWCTQVCFSEPRHLTKKEWIHGGTFPTDYNFLNEKVEYIVGMSVPPLMTARISNEVYNQILTKIK